MGHSWARRWLEDCQGLEDCFGSHPMRLFLRHVESTITSLVLIEAAFCFVAVTFANYVWLVIQLMEQYLRLTWSLQGNLLERSCVYNLPCLVAMFASGGVLHKLGAQSTNRIWKLSTLLEAICLCVFISLNAPLYETCDSWCDCFFFSHLSFQTVSLRHLHIDRSSAPVILVENDSAVIWKNPIMPNRVIHLDFIPIHSHGEHPPPPFHDHRGYLHIIQSLFALFPSHTFAGTHFNWRNSQPNKPPCWLSCRRKRSIPAGGFDTVVRLHVLSAKLGWNTFGKRDYNGTQKIFHSDFAKFVFVQVLCNQLFVHIDLAFAELIITWSEILGFELKQQLTLHHLLFDVSRQVAPGGFSSLMMVIFSGPKRFHP